VLVSILFALLASWLTDPPAKNAMNANGWLLLRWMFELDRLPARRRRAASMR